MAMNGDQLGDEIAAAMGYPFTSSYLYAFGNGIVDEIKNGVASAFNYPGPHTISSVSGSNMAKLIQGYAGYPFISTHLRQTCNAISDHVMQSGQVFYPLINGNWYLDGKISGLVGLTLANMIASYVGYPGVSDKLLAESTAIVNHIMSNAEVNNTKIT